MGEFSRLFVIFAGLLTGGFALSVGPLWLVGKAYLDADRLVIMAIGIIVGSLALAWFVPWCAKKQGKTNA